MANVNAARFQSVCKPLKVWLKPTVFCLTLILRTDILLDNLREEIKNYCNTALLLRSNSHYFYYVSNNNALFKTIAAFFVTNSLTKLGAWKSNQQAAKKRVEHLFPKIVYQLQAKVLDKLDSFFHPVHGWTKLWRMKNSRKQKLQHVWGNVSQLPFQYQIIFQKIQSSSAKLTRMTWCHLSPMLWKTLSYRVQRKAQTKTEIPASWSNHTKRIRTDTWNSD